ncbi:MAG: FtsX-like permease family protein [Acidobacteriota bacterium]
MREALEPELYLSYAQMPFFSQSHLVIRTSVAPAGLATAVQREVSSLDREALLSDSRTLEQHLGSVVAQPRFSAMLFGLFALLALLLGAVGLYGVMSYGVTQRTHEIGIRMALGAQARDVLRQVISQGMTLALAGVFAGLFASFALTRLLSSLLFGVSASDPLIFTGIAALLLLVALTACWIPARRATKVDPLSALRCQ